MVKYTLGNYKCHKCDYYHKPNIGLNEGLVTWICPSCKAVNHVLIDPVNMQAGHKLVLAGLQAANEKDYDIAAVLYYSAIDASLSNGIINLQNWRILKSNKAHIPIEKIKGQLRRRNLKQKVEWFQELSGTTIDAQVASKAHVLNKLANRISAARLKEKCELLGNERHKFLHYGEPVDANVVGSSVNWVIASITIIISMEQDVIRGKFS